MRVLQVYVHGATALWHVVHHCPGVPTWKIIICTLCAVNIKRQGCHNWEVSEYVLNATALWRMISACP